MGNKQTIFTDEQLDAYQVSLHGCVCILHVVDWASKYKWGSNVYSKYYGVQNGLKSAG